MYSDVSSFASAKRIGSELDAMLRVTRLIFGDGIRVMLEQDAENDDDVHLLFEAKCSGEVEEVLQKEDAWHEQAIELAPRAVPFFRLFIDIQ